VVGEPEPLTGEGLLEFAGVGPARVLAIPRPQQFAEKVHAYTFPWADRTNTRSKDLVDLVLLIETGPPEPVRVRAALEATFGPRKTPPLPRLPPPRPESWQPAFAAMAAEARLSPADYLEGFAILERFWATLGLPGRTSLPALPGRRHCRGGRPGR